MDYIVFERNSPFRFKKAAHMNIQVIAVPSQIDLEDRLRKLLSQYSRQLGGSNSGFTQIEDRD